MMPITALPQGPELAWAITYPQGGEGEWAPVAVASLIVFGVLAMTFLKHRARLQQQRLDLLRTLADRGQATPELVAEAFRPWGSRLTSAVMVAAWFLLIGGAGLTITALAQDWPDRFNEMGPPGLVMLGVAVATLSAPLMLRELRRQGAL